MPEAKGAGLVHGENWAAKCEPVGKSQLQVAACFFRKEMNVHLSVGIIHLPTSVF